MDNDFPIDLVVTYVDDTDPVWKNAAAQYNAELASKRFRSWNIFKYWFRGVERCMPFIRTVHLVVSNAEQVPEWLDQTAVDIVLHERIIPNELLPTFNSTTIEMYLHRIPDLAEQFIYSNDDMFSIRPLQISDFFKDRVQPQYKLIWRNDARNVFRMQCKNSYRLAEKLADVQPKDKYFYIAHSMTPSLKSVHEDVHSKAGNEILKRCTKFREPWNFTQYLFPDYAMLAGKAVEVKDIPFRYFQTNEIDQIKHEILNGGSKIICVNDHVIEYFRTKEKQLSDTFQTVFPEKSKFELYDTA